MLMMLNFFWDTEDSDQELSFDDSEDQKKHKAKHIVRCWLEDWEEAIQLEKLELPSSAFYRNMVDLNLWTLTMA